MKENTTLSISILSGKGGVGKTNLALNLGYCLHREAQSLLLMDCDLGLANLDVLLGLTPDKNLQDILESDTDPREAVVPIEKGGFDFIPASTGVPELIEMDEEMRLTLFQKMFPVFSSYDYLFLDLGAGITPTVLSFAAMTMMRILVITTEPTSLTDGYALVKVLSTQYKVRDFFVIVNMAESKKEEKQAFERFSAACKKFLDIDVNFLGAVRQDKALPDAVRKQVPLMKINATSPAAQDCIAISKTLQQLRAKVMPALAKQPVLRKVPTPSA